MKYLEYIQSQDTCKIDTSYTALSISRVLLKVNIQNGYTDYGAFFANSGNTSNGTRYFALLTRSNGFQFRTGNDQGTPFPFIVNTDYEVDCIRPTSSFTVNGAAGSTSGLGTIDDSNIFLFWDPAWNATSRHVYFKLYYCKMYDNDDTLVRDYIPVEDENGVGCLFDRITEQYYYTPTSTFIKGPEVEPPTPPTPGFSVNIQRNNSESIHLDKDLTNILATRAVLKSDTSLIDPVLLLEVDLATISLANYITIPQFNRSYFITNIRSVTNDLVELTCHVDVLSSFAADIRKNKGIVHRQENNWNLYLNDGSLHAYQNPVITTHLFPQGFSGQSYVLVLAGFRDEGNTIGEGTGYNPDSTGAGNVNGKTTAGLRNYAYAQLGKPYWYGTFGNTADADLLRIKRYQYPDNYPDPGVPDFTTQYGERVHDCVGLIKGYRWSEYPTSDPVYTSAEDVNVAGLYSQCTRFKGTVGPNMSAPLGAVLFYEDMSHCGVYYLQNTVIEARGHLYGVQQNSLTDRPGFTRWGVPNWMTINTPTPT